MADKKNKKIPTPIGDLELNVLNYTNNSRIAVSLVGEEGYDVVTINLSDLPICTTSDAFINADINRINSMGFNFIDILKDLGIIEKSYGTVNYNYGNYEYVKFDLDKIKEYDEIGVEKYKNEINSYGAFEICKPEIQIGGIYIRKKIKFKGKHYYIGVYTYDNGRLRLKYENKNESHDFTLNLDDAYIEEGKVFLDPIVLKDGFINILKKNRIIREVTGIEYYNYVEIPIAKINMGILREFDNYGVKKHLSERMDTYR